MAAVAGGMAQCRAWYDNGCIQAPSHHQCVLLSRDLDISIALRAMCWYWAGVELYACDVVARYRRDPRAALAWLDKYYGMPAQQDEAVMCIRGELPCSPWQHFIADNGLRRVRRACYKGWRSPRHLRLSTQSKALRRRGRRHYLACRFVLMASFAEH